MSASASSPRTVLGVYVTPQTLEAVLLRDADTGPKVLHRMLRPRLRSGDAPRSDDYAGVLPGMRSSEDVDFTLEVGEGGNDLDFDDAGLTSLPSAASNGPNLFTAQLREILTECRSLGVDTPDLAFCVDVPEVDYVAVDRRPEDATPDGGTTGRLWQQAADRWAGRAADPKGLRTALRATYERPFDARRVAFVPLAEGEERERYLALVPTEQESVAPTLRALAATDESISFVQRRLDAEASLLARVAATHVPAESTDSIAVVRVGGEDTLLLFLEGTTLRHVDHLRSVTSFDPVETICSRVLLHQDERRVDEIDHVLLVGGPRGGRLADGFASFYSDAAIHELSTLIRDDVTVTAEVDAGMTPESAVAVAAALQLLNDSGPNLLGKRARPRRRATAFAWHTMAMLGLLFGVSLFFGWHYMERQHEIADRKQRLEMHPVQLPELSPGALKQRVDSLNAVHARHNRALHVLDSLLVGSDEWSRAIERTARQTDEIDGLWLDNWSIDAATITLKGHALDRTNLAAFARNLGARVQELKFTDIQGVRAYPFTITMPRRIEMPEVTARLREKALMPEMQTASQQAAPPRTP